MEDRWYDLRVNVTIILVIIIFVINFGAQFLLYSNQNELAIIFFGSDTPQNLANIRWMIAASLLISAATLIFWGYYSDKYSKKKMLIFSSAIWIASCFFMFLMGASITYAQLFLAQIFFGLGFGAVYPICYSLLGDIVKPESRGKVYGVVTVIGGAGMAVGLFMGSAFHLGTYPFNWQMPFLIISIIGTVLILILLFFGTDLKKGAAEHELKEVLEDGAVYTYEIKREHLTALWKKPTNVYLFLQGIPGMIPWAVLLIVAPIYFQHLGYEANTANLIVLGSQVTNALGAIFAGWYGDRLAVKSQRKRVLFVALCILIPVPFFATAFLLPYPLVGPDAGLGVFFANPLYITGFLLIACGSFFAGSAGVNWYTITSDVNVPETRATIISFHALTDRIGNAFGPILAAIIGPLLVLGGQGEPLIIVFGVLFWIPCAVFWFLSMKTVDPDVLQMKNLLKTRAKELEAGLKSS